ncbi:IclR family transcriptional regulator [Pollutimonas thiosulfatoxidans]|uniref:IclR family transcriptional regulator n=1 Tax=Pollutimonas thiosulfatoxidans TaxID=2028345 RepID=A0A410GC78_9BURK|nr:IclR family transcriptional regulator [Pollutimonas thiosulfatoxidans]QAA93893.1 IclR family transcriptional regulator [Pollutimonas thiosulfatoxidans]
MDTTPLNDDDKQQAGPRTLRRGLLVLRALQEHSEVGLNITDLSRVTGLQRPTVYRLLAALVESGFARTVPASKRFKAVHAGTLRQHDEDPRIALALPVMQQLAATTGDAVFLVVRDGYESLSLWREIGPYPVQILATFAGKRQPLGVGSGGMALLAALDDAKVEQIIVHNNMELEQYGGMTTREMRQLVQNTRSRGYSVVGNYAVRGALGVGCALCDAKGDPRLAISVTAITERMPVARQREIAGLIRAGLSELMPVTC